MNAFSDTQVLTLPNGVATGEPLPTVVVDGLRIHAITEAECIHHVVSSSRSGRGGAVVTPNLDHLRRYQRDPEFRELVEACELVVPDGMPLVWASWLQGTPLPQRVAGSSLISTLSAAAAEAGLSVFLLGGDPGTADQAAEVLRARHPALRIAGTCCPWLDSPLTPTSCQALATQLQEARPDIVFVALGAPKQERLIAALRPSLPQAWWVGVGISFSFLCGRVVRAPVWMQKTGLEWLHRLWEEPHRLARRYLVEGLPFAAGLLLRAPCRRFQQRPWAVERTAAAHMPAVVPPGLPGTTAARREA